MAFAETARQQFRDAGVTEIDVVGRALKDGSVVTVVSGWKCPEKEKP